MTVTLAKTKTINMAVKMTIILTSVVDPNKLNFDPDQDPRYCSIWIRIWILGYSLSFE